MSVCKNDGSTLKIQHCGRCGRSEVSAETNEDRESFAFTAEAIDGGMYRLKGNWKKLCP